MPIPALISHMVLAMTLATHPGLPEKTNGFDLWSTIDGGGGTSVGGTFQLNATIAQADAVVMTGNDFRLTGGFWAVTRNPTIPTTIFSDGFESGDCSAWSGASGC